MRGVLFAVALSLLGLRAFAISQVQPDTFVAAYYFPQFHADPRNEELYGAGWTEWEIFKNATGRGSPAMGSYAAPLWGYEDESDPKVFEKKISAAYNSSVNAFIFDWYWYDGGPFLNRALENGYMKAANNSKVKFAIMWANHDWINYYSDTSESSIYSRFDEQAPNPAFLMRRWDGVVPGQVNAMWDYMIDQYFLKPNYWKINGKPYFMIFRLNDFIRKMGGYASAKQALQNLQAKAIAKGLRGIHIAAANAGVSAKVFPWGEGLSSLGISSITNYTWGDYTSIRDYGTMTNSHVGWSKSVISHPYAVPYFPVVTVGWDTRFRCLTDPKLNAGYPYTPTMTGSSPALFQEALRRTRDVLPSDPAQRVILINAWNEWTEGSHLEPDTKSGYGYLNAVKAVFSKEVKK